MSLRRLAPVLATVIILAGCAPGAGEKLAPISVYATSAASPWLETAYACSPAGSGIILGAPAEADVIIRLAEPRPLTTPAFQVGSDELLVVAHPEVAVGRLSPEQVQALFTGQFTNWLEVGGSDQPVQVWVYAPTVDIQMFFARAVLDDRPVSSVARLAVSAQDMSDSLGATPGSVGLLPRRWKAGNTREILNVGALPVLALTRESPGPAVAGLIACMQARP